MGGYKLFPREIAKVLNNDNMIGIYLDYVPR